MANVKKSPATSAAVLTGYCMKTKKKNVPMVDAVIDASNGRFIAKGHDGKNNKMAIFLNREKAEAAIAAGGAKKGSGWGKK